MNKPLTVIKRTLGVLLILTFFVLTTTSAQDGKRSFGAYDSGLKRGKWSPNRQAKLLSELGYDSIVYKGMKNLDRRLAALRKHDIGLQAVQVHINLDRDGIKYSDLERGMQILSGTGTIIWIQIRGSEGGFEKAVNILRQLSRRAVDHGLNIVIYPHYGQFVETTPDALRIAKKVNRSNVGVSFNLCHSLKAGNVDRMPAILTKAAPYLKLVQINGARNGDGGWAEQRWEKLIRPLDDSEFDLRAYLDHLDRIGYIGPVCLMPYGIDLPPEEHLSRSMSAWTTLHK